MPLSADTVHHITQAAGCAHWACPHALLSIEAAAKASNPASAFAELNAVEANLEMLLARVRNAIERCRREAHGHDDAPDGTVARALYDGLAPRPKLTVVRNG